MTESEKLRQLMNRLNEESEHEKDEHAEKAGREVAKDIEYDEGHKGKDDDKAEKAGKKVTKDIEWDEKHKHNESYASEMRALLETVNEGHWGWDPPDYPDEPAPYYGEGKRELDDVTMTSPIALPTGEQPGDKLYGEVIVACHDDDIDVIKVVYYDEDGNPHPLDLTQVDKQWIYKLEDSLLSRLEVERDSDDYDDYDDYNDDPSAGYELTDYEKRVNQFHESYGDKMRNIMNVLTENQHFDKDMYDADDESNLDSIVQRRDDTVVEDHDDTGTVIQDILSGALDAYEVLAHPSTKEEEIVSDILMKEIEDISYEHHLHLDDDLEELLGRAVDALEAKYGEEQLDELSIDTIRAYDDATNTKTDEPFDSPHNARLSRRAEPDKVAATARGHMNAIKRLNKHDFPDIDPNYGREKVDELSRKTLGDYIKKASRDLFSRGLEGGKLSSTDDYSGMIGNEKKALKRKSGIDSAVGKLGEGFNDISIERLQSYIQELRMAQDHVDSAEEWDEIEDQIQALFAKADHGDFDYETDDVEITDLDEFADAGSGCDWQLNESAHLSKLKKLFD